MPPRTVTVDLSGALSQYGGTGLARQITDAFMVNMARAVEGTAIPRMRDAIPVRTGRLRQALGVTFSRRDLVITVGFAAKGYYWNFVPGLTKRLEEIFAEVVQSSTQPALNLALAQVLPRA